MSHSSILFSHSNARNSTLDAIYFWANGIRRNTTRNLPAQVKVSRVRRHTLFFCCCD